MPHNEQYVATTADDMGQRTTNVYELLTINEIVQEPPAHSSLNVQIATVPSITMDAAITPATCKELDKACAIVVEAKIMATTPSVCVQQSALDLPIEQMVLQVATYVEDVVMVEEASENEEAGSVMDLTFGDPVDLVIASDGSTQCGVEAKRPPMEAAFPIDVTATKIEELQVVTSIENVVIVEDASNDEEDPTAIAVVDCPTLSH